MTVSDMALAARVASLAAAVLELDPADLKGRPKLVDLGLDSLRLLFLIDSLEKEFGLALIAEGLHAGDFETVDAIVQLIRRRS